MSRFIAIPVVVGDAFYLERKSFSVLVDGGKSSSGFSQLFYQNTKKNYVDVLVCTHNDADHTNGIISFLREGFRCRELWLPGKWTGCIDSVIAPTRDFINEIIAGAEKYFISQNISPEEYADSFEKIGEKTAESLETTYDENRPKLITKSDDYPPSLSQWADKIEYLLESENVTVEDSWLPKQADQWREYMRYHDFLRNRINYDLWRSSKFGELIDNAIDAGNRIREIAQLAYAAGINVRWFEYDPANSSIKASKFLQVLSAKEVLRVHLTPNLFLNLALTTFNKESLVLYSPPDKESPGVLFCADSALENIIPPVQAHDLITAPHHGAEANKQVYEKIEKLLGSDADSLTWVRSDFRSKHRPCRDYVELNGRKFCTVCANGSYKQTVKINGKENLWIPQKATKLCFCGKVKRAGTV